MGVKFQCKSLQTFFLRVDWKSQPIFVNLDLDICITPLKVEWQKWKIMVFPEDPFSLGPGKCSGANCEISLGYMTYPFLRPQYKHHGWMKIHHVQPLLGWCFKNPYQKGTFITAPGHRSGSHLEINQFSEGMDRHQGSFNFPFFWGSNLMQRHGRFDRFPFYSAWSLDSYHISWPLMRRKWCETETLFSGCWIPGQWEGVLLV